jgi:glycosyltransferase involved in cell wall biosynthesis
MRIAIDSRLAGGTSTGDSTYWTNLIPKLANLESDIQILLVDNKEPEISVPNRAEKCIVTAKSSLWWSLVRFPLAARKWGADVTHTQYSLSPLCRNGVTTIHDVSFFVGPEWFSDNDLNNMRRRIPIAVRASKAVITVSETSRREIEFYLPLARGKTFVAQNACPPNVRPNHHLSLSFGSPFVLSVGTQWARKNMNLAVDAIIAAAELVPHKLVLTGKYKEQIDHPRVVQTGYVDQETLNALYTMADLYLAPSLHEGFGIPILESFRCGTPVIVGPGGALPEVVGDAGWIAKDYTTETWTNLITEVLRNPSKLQEFAKRGIEREKLFSWEKSAASHLEAYRFACQKWTKSS